MDELKTIDHCLPELDDHGMQVIRGDDDWYCRHCDELLEECMCDE